MTEPIPFPGAEPQSPKSPVRSDTPRRNSEASKLELIATAPQIRAAYSQDVDGHCILDQQGTWINTMLEKTNVGGEGSLSKEDTGKVYEGPERFSDEVITAYLKGCGFYSPGTTGWACLTGNRDPEPTLYPHIEKIIKDILRHFGVLRNFTNMSSTPLKHKEIQSRKKEDRNRLPTSKPDFIFSSRTSTVLRVEGPEHEAIDPSAIRDYSRCVSILEVKRLGPASTHGPSPAHLEQLSLYVHQCFGQQRHRHFVFVVLLSPAYATLYLFDRSGVVRSQPFLIADASAGSFSAAIRFVRLILLVSSNHAPTVGVDPSWFYRGGFKYVRVKDLAYKHLENISHHVSIFGSASACYKVEGPVSFNADENASPSKLGATASKESDRKASKNAKESRLVRRFILKSSWCHDRRTPEPEILNTLNAKGVAGIATVVAFDDSDTLTTRSARAGLQELSPSTEKEPAALQENFQGRIRIQFLQEFVGSTIEHWKDPVSLLKALLDVVKGDASSYSYYIVLTNAVVQALKDMYNAGFLHRDICSDNVLLVENADRKSDFAAAVLIDFDMAIDLTRKRSLQRSDFRSGSTLFHSLAILARATPIAKRLVNPPQDYLDDLESVLWVLVLFVYGYDGPGKKREGDEPFWDAKSERELYLKKYSLFEAFCAGAPDAINPAEKRAPFPDYWKIYQTPVSQLLRTLAATLHPFVMEKKLDLTWKERVADADTRRQELAAGSEDVFGTFIKALESAVKAIETISDGLGPPVKRRKLDVVSAGLAG